MLDLKKCSNEELKELKDLIDKELFIRNGEYKVGEIYRQTRGNGNYTYLYIIKKVDNDAVYVNRINLYDDYIEYSDKLEYTYKELEVKKLKKLEISENEINEWYDELCEKLGIIRFNTEKEVNTLINLYLDKIIKV